MNGGTISGGSAVNGGGVYNAGIMFMAGGTISGNTVSGEGGAIYTTGTLNMLSNPVIVGNTKTNSGNNNVYLPSGKVISVLNAFTNGAIIGVTMADGYGVFTTG